MPESSLALVQHHPFNFAVTNPFCAARLRPGTIDFVFEQGRTIGQLIDALEVSAWHGQITGGHGTGKSTLLTALTPAMEDRGRIVKSITLVAGQRHLPRDFLGSLRQTAGLGVAVVDGIEQLHIWNGLSLRRFCLSHGLGLVAASHFSAHLPELYQTAVDESRAWNVVERLQCGFPTRIEIGDLQQRLARHQGNLRETLFDLYDLYEERSRRL